MDKNLIWKVVLILVLVVAAGLTLYPPKKTLKPGIDLAGGTSLIYEIDTHGLGDDLDNLSQRMIDVLRRRIDPANIQNLIWRPQGNTRFEIQVPLASARARVERENYQNALDELLAKNVSPAEIMRSLKLPKDEREKAFDKFAQGSDERRQILDELANIYDQRNELRKRSDQLSATLKTVESTFAPAGIVLDQVKSKRNQWSKLDDEKLREALTEFLGGETNLDLLTKYVNTYAEWAEVARQLTDPVTGKNMEYKNKERQLDKFSLTIEQLNSKLEAPRETSKFTEGIDELKSEFPDRAELIDKLVAAFDEYMPYRGRLDDPKDIQRMVKGAGILEFRILPTYGHAQTDADEMAGYIESLQTKGPKFASTMQYVWAEVENEDEALKLKATQTVVAQFGGKPYVLASNKPDEVMLHRAAGRDWKLEKASAGRDPRTGARAVDFGLDERAGKIFGKLTGNNIGRPLCILLDGIAISAPNINSRITTSGQITGAFTETQVNDMVNKLNAGSLPAQLIEQPISVKTIGPSIGADNRDQGIKAGIIGLIVVVACMAIYYTLAGTVADVALLMNLLFILGIMAFLRATFTLPGIAGMILTIGMSVDANVLIFERIREEQLKGSSLRIAIRNGYQRAFRTIIDANLTTFMTAAILYWVASEEIKGFAIVLMLGIASSMFTALFVTRVIFDLLSGWGLIKDHLIMLRLIHRPNVNWMAVRPLFLTISLLLISGGLVVFFTRDQDTNNKYDIEFTGGTSAQINLKHHLSRQEVEDRIHRVGTDPNNPNPALAAANVYSIGKSGKQYEITTTETNKAIAFVTMTAPAKHSPESVKAAIKKAEAAFDRKLSNLQVTEKTDAEGEFVVTTSQMNKSLVREVLSSAFPDAQISEVEIERTVDDAILAAFGDELEILRSLRPEIASQQRITEKLVESYPELGDFMGGVRINCNIQVAATAAELNQRLMDLRFKPDTQQLKLYDYKLLDSDLSKIEPNQPVQSFVYLSAEPEAVFRQLDEDEWKLFAENETAKVLAATQLETSLPRVTQIDPSVGAEAKTRALIAIVLSLCAIVGYIWVRFGTARYGIAAIVALVHDVCITLGAVAACTYIASTPIGEKLLIGDFKINLAMIAAFLTLIGYSLNDTIVVFDRIRENRRKARLVPQTITDSINQTISRTILTSFTTFIVVLIMYIFGGPGLRGFTFAIGFGIIVGTYSSIAIAAPILLIGVRDKTKKG